MFLFLSLPLWFEPFGLFCILFVYFEGTAFGVSSFFYIHIFLSIKKKYLAAEIVEHLCFIL